LCLDN